MKTTKIICSTFPLGQILATPGALRLVDAEQLLVYLARHSRGDWGTVDTEDWALNDHALEEGTRLLSAYEVDGEKIWIITEADRSATTILLPEEY
jgi:hypothetical protein